MKHFSNIIHKMLSNMASTQGGNSSGSQASPQSTNAPSPQPTPTTKPTQTKKPPASGERQRTAYKFQSADPSTSLEGSDETWTQQGGVLIGETIKTQTISASGAVTSVENLSQVCCVCNKMDDSDIRSEISHKPLCRTCQCEFEQPDGTRIVVTPAELAQLQKSFNTWERFDHQQSLKQQHETS